MKKRTLIKFYLLFIVISISILTCSCSITNEPDIRVLIKVKCVYKSDKEARFESNNYDYSEIIVQNDVSEYKVGKYYYLEIKKK